MLLHHNELILHLIGIKMTCENNNGSGLALEVEFLWYCIYVLVYMLVSDVPAVRPAEGGGVQGGRRSERTKHEQKDRNPVTAEYFHVYLLLPVVVYVLSITKAVSRLRNSFVNVKVFLFTFWLPAWKSPHDGVSASNHDTLSHPVAGPDTSGCSTLGLAFLKAHK